MSESVTLVLDHTVAGDDVEALARREGWRLRADTPRGHDVLASRHYAAGDDTSVLHGEDHNGRYRFLQIDGADASAVAQAVTGALSCVSPTQVLSRIREGDPRTCIRTAGMLMRVRPDAFDAAHYDALCSLLTHDDVPVRRAGIRAAYGCQWPQLVTFVREQLERKQRPQPGLEALLAWLQSPEMGEEAP